MIIFNRPHSLCSIETTPLLDNEQAHDIRRHNKNDQMPLSLSSSDNEEYDSSDDGGFAKKLLRKQHQQLKPSTFVYRLKDMYRKGCTFSGKHLTLTHNQKMVLKCSFAYMIGSLFTFIPALNALCGTHIASHMAATVTVFFNPAKSVGGMVEAAGFGWLYTLAALTLSLASMYTTDYFLDNDMSMIASFVSLGVWLAGSTFAISYLKARINTPSILTGIYIFVCTNQVTLI